MIISFIQSTTIFTYLSNVTPMPVAIPMTVAYRDMQRKRYYYYWHKCIPICRIDSIQFHIYNIIHSISKHANNNQQVYHHSN